MDFFRHMFMKLLSQFESVGKDYDYFLYTFNFSALVRIHSRLISNILLIKFSFEKKYENGIYNQIAVSIINSQNGNILDKEVFDISNITNGKIMGIACNDDVYTLKTLSGEDASDEDYKMINFQLMSYINAFL